MTRWNGQGLAIIACALTSSLIAAAALGRLDAAQALDRPGIAHETRTQIPKSADGHYWADGRIGETSIRLLVDTGASQVVLTSTDAARLGIAPPMEAFDQPLRTASGTMHAAPVVLDELAVGGARVNDVPALVVDGGLAHSLLGMSYLGALAGFEASRSGLTLRS